MEYIDFTGNKAKVSVDELGYLHLDIKLGRPVPEGIDIDQVLATIGYIPILAKEPRRFLRVIK